MQEHSKIVNRFNGFNCVYIGHVGVEDFQPLQIRRNEYQKVISNSIGSIIRGFKIGVTKWFWKNTDVYTV